MKIGKLLITFFLFLLAGCGNFLESRPAVKAPVSYQSEANIVSDNTTADGFTCPTTDNVTPDYDWLVDGSGYFTVCTHAEKTSSVQVHGKTYSKNQTICLIPANDSEKGLFPVVEQKTGNIVTKCIKTNEDGALVDFTAIDFNFLFIVDAHDLNQTLNCLKTATYSKCPAQNAYFSFGKIK